MCFIYVFANNKKNNNLFEESFAAPLFEGLRNRTCVANSKYTAAIQQSQINLTSNEAAQKFSRQEITCCCCCYSC